MQKQASIPAQGIEHVALSLVEQPVVQRAVRVLSLKRLRRMRALWFSLGMLMGCAGLAVVQSAVTAVNEMDWSSFSHSEKSQGFASVLPVDIEPEAPSAESEPEKQSQALRDAAPEPADNNAEEQVEAENSDGHYFLRVNRGDTLIDLLVRKGVENQEAHAVVAAIRPQFNLRRINPGQKIELQLSQEKNPAFRVSSLKIRINPRQTLELRQTAEDGMKVSKMKAVLERGVAAGGGKIESSLYQTGMDTNVPPAILSELVNAFSYDIDFQREVKNGDSFNVLYESMRNEEGVQAGHGKLLFASLNVNGKAKKIYRYAARDGQEGYYNERGESIRKALLRTPVNGARLSSGFGMRFHPVLGYSKMHKGVDFAAPTGTPVYAAGNGTVDFAGRRGSFGNYIRVKHNGTYSTAYAHLSRIAPSLRAGRKVSQGQIIGYVGTTGRSTGPHLHYEVLAHNTQVNPKSIQLKSIDKLTGRDLANFRETIKQMQLDVARLLNNQPSFAKAE